MKEVQVEVAMDQFGKIKPVSCLLKNDKNSWTCIECGEKLIARTGDNRRYHWAHKSNTTDCGGGESYEHKIAKDIIQNEIPQCTFFKRCNYRQFCDGLCSERHNSPFWEVKETKWPGGKFYEILKQRNKKVYENLHCVLEDRSLQKEMGMIPDVLLYKDEIPVGVIEVEHTNPKKREEIDKFLNRFDGFFFELKAKDILRGKLKNMKKEFSSYNPPLEKCHQCGEIKAPTPYHCFSV
tara:strand:+ start:181 stop:891 length:711 start_codon:yes stop_codon:yes gene_type:complete